MQNNSISSKTYQLWFFFIEGLSRWRQYYVTLESNNNISYLARFLIMDTIVFKDQMGNLQIIDKRFSGRSLD